MAETIAQPLTVVLDPPLIRAVISPATTTTEAQGLGRAVAGVTQHVVIKPGA